jgi:5-methyltetrahydropteroyltriglutamate--homocysteine methyltransferase
MVVGSTPQPAWLVERAAGSTALRFKLDGDDFAEAARDAIRIAALDQRDAGLDVIGDGEQDRLSYRDHFVRRMTGVEYPDGGHAPRFEVPPRVVGPLSLPSPVAVTSLPLIRAIASHPVKLTVIGPFTLARRMEDAYYGDPDTFGRAVAAVINGELRALQAAGCDVVQIDEPHFTAVSHPPERIAWGVDLVNRALDGITVPVVMHVCFGYAAAVRDKSEAKASTAYHAVLPHVRDARPGILSLELEQPKADLSVLALCPGKRFLLGLLDLGTEAIETPEHIAARIDEAARIVGRDRLLAGPDCGMKFLPRAVAQSKLRSLVAGAALARGR